MAKIIKNGKTFYTYTLKELSEIENIPYAKICKMARDGKIVQVIGKRSVGKRGVLQVVKYLDINTSNKLITLNEIKSIF